MKAAVYVIIAAIFELAVVRAVPLVKMGCRKQRPHFNIQIREDNVIDLTHVFDKNTAKWPNLPGFKLTEHFKGYAAPPLQAYYAMNLYSSPEHLGTHMDAPSHANPHGDSIEKINLVSLMGQGVLIDLVKDGTPFPQDEFFTIEHFLQWEKKHGRIRNGSIVLINAGYGEHYSDYKKYYATNTTGPDAALDLHFPGLSAEAAEWLVSHRCIAAIGSDTMSIDRGMSRDFLAHKVFLRHHRVPIFEMVANLHKLREAGERFKVMAMPMNIKDGTGAPTRIVAVLDK